MLKRSTRPLLLLLGLLGLWQLLVWLSGVPVYILPSPWMVARSIVTNIDLLAAHSAITIVEILLGLALGTLLGVLCALILQLSVGLRDWILPLLIASQAIPVFALAPLLMLWLGYGMSAKIVMSLLIIFFPIATATYDGLRRTPPSHLALAHTLGATRLQQLLFIRIPAALPAFASGMRIAAAIAPIGAVIGEWVGGSQGLGYLMLYANARMNTDLMFAALAVLTTCTLILYFTTDRLLSRWIFWSSTP
ncbi:ABC transporter permease [Suttonella sp. R2A3]|uniref:ABC transporter permease n=1 Tax=Suttonella sp. R2A3 TaxID=2908648 RepID=UPI001F157DE7|nr:ABC transporter permease [Suttonella sp. R2A3]UJF25284.1 ABC transporter permease [Suttonella sp. R2A3]